MRTDNQQTIHGKENIKDDIVVGGYSWKTSSSAVESSFLVAKKCFNS